MPCLEKITARSLKGRTIIDRNFVSAIARTIRSWLQVSEQSPDGSKVLMKPLALCCKLMATQISAAQIQ